MKKIQLRAIEPSDIESIFRWENDREIWEVSNTLTPFSRYILEQYILSANNQDIYSTKQLRLMIDVVSEDKHNAIGTLDLFDFDPHHLRAGVGILIDKKERRKGYAKMALKEMIDYAFHFLHLHQLYCNIASDNQVSMKLFESMGFEKAGLKKDWLHIHNGYSDEYFLQLIQK